MIYNYTGAANGIWSSVSIVRDTRRTEYIEER